MLGSEGQGTGVETWQWSLNTRCVVFEKLLHITSKLIYPQRYVLFWFPWYKWSVRNTNTDRILVKIDPSHSQRSEFILQVHVHPQSSPKGKKAFTQTFSIHPLLQFHVKSAVFTMIVIAMYIKTTVCSIASDVLQEITSNSD